MCGVTKPIMVFSCAMLAVFCITVSYAKDPPQADKYMARGEAAVENAQDRSDYEDAIKEFEKAVELAPDWADAYYNLSVAQEGAERYKESIDSLKRYMELTDNAEEVKSSERKIYKLEYLAEKSGKKGTKQGTVSPATLAQQLQGRWYARFKLGGQDFYLPRNKPYQETFEIEAYGDALKFIDKAPAYFKDHYNAQPGDVLFRLDLSGTELSGIHHQRYRNTHGLNPPLDVSVIGDISKDRQTIVLHYTQKYINVWNKGNGNYVPHGIQNIAVEVILKRRW